MYISRMVIGYVATQSAPSCLCEHKPSKPLVGDYQLHNAHAWLQWPIKSIRKPNVPENRSAHAHAQAQKPALDQINHMSTANPDG